MRKGLHNALDSSAAVVLSTMNVFTLFREVYVTGGLTSDMFPQYPFIQAIIDGDFKAGYQT